MYNKNGFTLLELLIAAALIGVLAMFATQAFRASASGVRWEDAKARAQALAIAARRYYIEYPNSPSFPTGASNYLKGFLVPDRTGAACNTTGAVTVQNLVDCGFLEYRQVACEGRQVKDGNKEYYCHVKMWFDSITPETADVEVCFEGQGLIKDEDTYCTDGNIFYKAS